MAISPSILAQIAATYGTPVWVYDAAIIRRQIMALASFDVIRFAQKACSNVHILGLMKRQGVVVDAVSMGEVQRAFAAGYNVAESPSSIVFTADVMDRRTLDFLMKENITVNAGSIDMLHQIGQKKPGHKVWIRVNPGFGHGHSAKTNTGGENSKHGIWYEDLPEALAVIQTYKLDLVGLHIHIGSGVDYEHLSSVCGAMVSLVTTHRIDVQAISAGGGLSVPYYPDETAVDPAHYFNLWDVARKEIEAVLGHAVSLEIEPGRYLVAESGVLVSEVRARKNMGARCFVLLDAGFTELVRPSFYGSHHEISAITSQGEPITGELSPVVVGGPLCESGDVFTQAEGGLVLPRLLPKVHVGDFLVLHTAGAYGASMSSNYNSRPYAPEVLVDGDKINLIRRRQSMEDLLALELDARPM